MDVNQFTITGSVITTNEKLSAPLEEKKPLSFTVSAQRAYKKDLPEGTYNSDAIPVKVFGKTAEFVQQYVKQGSRVIVSGKISTGSYETQEGEKRYTLDLVANQVSFQSGVAKEAKEGGNQSAPAAPAAPAQAAPAAPAAPADEPSIEIDEEELPFR